jgi:glycosyltransferase involved in cell wall biosynthesis
VANPPEVSALRLALVLWNGAIGGAENFFGDLAGAMQNLGADPSVVFVEGGLTLSARLDRAGVPHASLGFKRGRGVLAAPRRLAHAVSRHGPDVAVLVEPGFLAAALRVGGYRAPIVGVEHGPVLELPGLPPPTRLIRAADLASGAKACSVVVAVSEFVSERVAELRPRRRIVCIPNGVDLRRFAPARTAEARLDDQIVVAGCAARLIEGKGVDDVIRALADRRLKDVRLRVAGGGPCAQDLEALVLMLGVRDRVELLGPVLDMPSFWRSVDVAVVPSNTFVESFGIAAVEAMASGKPVIASRNGALPSIVVDGETGTIFPPGDTAALVAALASYAADPALRHRHGADGRARCEREFSIQRAASRYLELCAQLVR